MTDHLMVATFIVLISGAFFPVYMLIWSFVIRRRGEWRDKRGMTDQEFESRAIESAQMDAEIERLKVELAQYSQGTHWRDDEVQLIINERDNLIAEVEEMRKAAVREINRINFEHRQSDLEWSTEIQSLKTELEQAKVEINDWRDRWTEAAEELDNCPSCKQLESEKAKAKSYWAKLQSCHDHCLCTRNTYGFDYGEKHARLGNPKPGARWLTPVDIARQALAELGGEK